MEATEAEVYRRLAKMQKDPVNRSILKGISLEAVSYTHLTLPTTPYV